MAILKCTAKKQDQTLLILRVVNAELIEIVLVAAVVVVNAELIEIVVVEEPKNSVPVKLGEDKSPSALLLSGSINEHLRKETTNHK